MVRTSPGLYNITLNGIDVTLYTHSASFKKYRKQPVKNGTVNFKRSVTNILTISDTLLGAEIIIQRGFIASTERYLFRGEILSYKQKGSLFEFNIVDKMYAANRLGYDYSYDWDIDSSAGVGSEIVKDLLTQAGLSYNDASIPTTGTNSNLIIKRFQAKDSILNSLKELAKIYQRIFFYNDEDDLVYFIEDGYTPTSTILTTGIDITNRIQWNTTSEDMANNITIIGGAQLDWNLELFTGDGSTVDYTLTAIPVDTEIYVNNVLKSRGVDSSDPKDFIVNAEAKLITFTAAPTLGHSIEIYYSYNVPVKVNSADYNSITNYKQRDLTIVDTKMTNTDDTELQVGNILSDSAEALTSAPLRVLSNNDLLPGQSIQVVDTINNMTRDVEVVSVNYVYPYQGDTIEVGKVPTNMLDINLNIIDSIQKIQRDLASTSEINVQLINLNAELEVSGYQQMEKAGMFADTLYWDSATQGTWDNFKWSDTATETYTEQFIIPINNVVYEDFRSTDMIDGTSDATINTTDGRAEF